MLKVNHKTVLVARDEVEIDELLAPLIPLLWKLGINTEQCCQEREPGRAWIVFPSTDDACHFLYIAQKRYKVELERWDEGSEDMLSPAMNLIVWFPTKDIPKLVARFSAALKVLDDERDDE